MRPDEGVLADLRLLCTATALLPEEVSVQARQPQALPPHRQRERRILQAAQLLCAAQPASLDRLPLMRSDTQRPHLLTCRQS